MRKTKICRTDDIDENENDDERMMMHSVIRTRKE